MGTKYKPWLAWFSRLSAGLQTKRLVVRFLVRAHARVVGQAPSQGVRETTDMMYRSHIGVSLPVLLPPWPPL